MVGKPEGRRSGDYSEDLSVDGKIIL